MRWTFLDEQDDANTHNGITLYAASDLTALYESIRDRPPFFFSLVHEGGARLLVGFGRHDVGCIQYTTPGDASVHLVAVGDISAPVDGPIGAEFLCGDTPTPIVKRYCVPFNDVVRFVGNIVDTGMLAKDVTWEEI
jgi:hypothetical protein